MDDTTMYITKIFLNWFYRLITYVKLLIFIQVQIRLGTNKQQQRNDYISGNMNILHTTSVRPFVFYYIIKHWQGKRLYYTTPSPILYTGYEGNNTFIVPKVQRGQLKCYYPNIKSISVLLYWKTVQFKILN
jgi:hypothetical protein